MGNAIITTEQAEEVAGRSVAIALRGGATAAEAAVTSGTGLSVTVRNGEVESIEHHRDKVMSVTTYIGQRRGSATTTDFRNASLEETVGAAIQIAKNAEDDRYCGLIDERYLATEIPDLDLDHPWDISAAAAIDTAKHCDAAARDFDARVDQVDDTTVSRYRGSSAYTTSHGFSGSFAASRHSLSCVVVGKNGEGMQRGHWFTTARDADDLEAAATVGRTAAERTVARLGARKIPTGRWPVLFEARVAGSLFGHLIGAVSGPNLYRKASFLLDAVGRPVFRDFVQIEEQPHVRKGLGSAPYDSEGATTHDRALIADGRLTGYVLDSYAARRLELEPTGNAGGVHNVTVTHGDESFAELIENMGRGVIVTELMGFGVNLMTGDYSRGATGFWVEHGQIQYPVEEITVAGNLKEIFLGITAIGTDVDRRGNILTGSVMIEAMTIAGS